MPAPPLGSRLRLGEKTRDRCRITFRRLAYSDLPLLHRWLNAPHVLEWWDRPGPTFDEVRTKYLSRLSTVEGFAAYVIRRAGTPIGYIQLYRVHAGAWALLMRIGRREFETKT